MESFAALFEESLARQEMRQGEVITAEVVSIDHNFVVVNAGLKSESYVPVEEFRTTAANSKSRSAISSRSRSIARRRLRRDPPVARSAKRSPPGTTWRRR
jgi:hypothetical protein